MKSSSYISTEKELVNVEKIHDYINKVSYWGRGRSIEEVKKTIEHSLCFGIYNRNDEQMGFARIVTDYVAFGYVMDVIVFDEFQGKGYGNKLIEGIMNHDVVMKLKTIALKTKDAHELYEKFDFKSIGDSELWMANDRLKLL